jgi:alkylation response protein AidB-like acyl-CoA dehydrogenase
MSMAVTEEREDLVRGVRDLLTKRATLSRTREILESGAPYDTDLWGVMSEQLALPAMAVPEAHGGAGFGYAELALVAEELGRVLVPSPFFATVGLALPALLASEDEGALDEYAPALAAGAKTGTLAWVEDDGSWAGGSATTATQAGKSWTLDGHKTYVVDGATADTILVIAQTPSGASLFAVEGDADGVVRHDTPTFDQTRRLARIELNGAPARLVGAAGAGAAILSATMDRASVLLAAEMVGGAQACLEMSVSYAKDRVQFGRPIGSFQAIKHKCAEMLVAVESARSAAQYGGWAATESLEELPLVACVAKAVAGDAFFHVAGENVQIHGGIGCTWEHDAHLYLKRAKTSGILLGGSRHQRALLADRLGF